MRLNLLGFIAAVGVGMIGYAVAGIGGAGIAVLTFCLFLAWADQYE